MKKVSRRAILQSIGLVGLGSFTGGLPPLLAQTDQELPPIPPRWQGQPLGRVSNAWLYAREDTNVNATVLKELRQDTVVRVRRVVEGQTIWLHNALWLETEYGYCYSSFVQPMWYHLPNPPQADLGAGRWAEVTVPATDAYWDADSRNEDRFAYSMTYGSVFRVTELVAGADGKSWYKVKELYQEFYMRATHLRLIPDEDLTPLSTEVDPRDKRLEVDIKKQLLIAYERNAPVWVHRTSTGVLDHGTPHGNFYVHDKRASDRMTGGAAAADEDADRYNLAGVPFVSYFTSEWVSVHGTYWHNDYGIPRSHGCVNLPPDAARWVWRWTTPYVTDLAQFVTRQETYGDGTLVVVY